MSASSSQGESKSGSEVSGGSGGGETREEGSSHQVVQWFWEIMENRFNNFVIAPYDLFSGYRASPSPPRHGWVRICIFVIPMEAYMHVCRYICIDACIYGGIHACI